MHLIKTIRSFEIESHPVTNCNLSTIGYNTNAGETTLQPRYLPEVSGSVTRHIKRFYFNKFVTRDPCIVSDDIAIRQNSNYHKSFSNGIQVYSSKWDEINANFI